MKNQSITKTHVLLIYLISLIVLGSLTSCEDHREAIDPLRFRLKKTVRTTAYRADTKDTTTIVYTYDTKGKLSTETQVETSTYGPMRYLKNSTFTYDPQNRLTQIDTEYSGNYMALERFEYTYDSAGNITLETKLTKTNKWQPGNYQVTGKTEFTYDGSRFPATLTNIYGTSRYTYLNGNVSLNGYEYDDKPNPYYGIIRSEGIQILQFNVNNQREDLVAEPKRLLTYNSSGLLVRLNIVHRPTPPYNYDEQTIYEYEAY